MVQWNPSILYQRSPWVIRLLWSLTIACSKNFVVEERKLKANWKKKKVKLEADWFCFKREVLLSQELPLVTRCCSCLHSIFVVPTTAAARWQHLRCTTFAGSQVHPSYFLADADIASNYNIWYSRQPGIEKVDSYHLVNYFKTIPVCLFGHLAKGSKVDL